MKMQQNVTNQTLILSIFHEYNQGKLKPESYYAILHHRNYCNNAAILVEAPLTK